MSVYDGVVGRAEMQVDSDGFSVKIPLSMLGGDDGYINTAAVVGNPTGPTDCVPNSGSLGVRRVYLPLAIKQ